MTEGASWLEARRCKNCGKTFAVLYPHLWRYKDDKGKYFCSWRCLREDERKEAENMKKKDGAPIKVLTEEQKRTACEMARRMENPLPYLKECGMSNPTSAWVTCRKWAEKNWGVDEADELPERFRKPKAQSLEEIAEELAEDGVELVYDESIAEEYRREQEQKKANERAREEAEKDSECVLDMEPLEVCAVRSRVRKDCSYTVNSDGEMYMSNGGMWLQFPVEEWIRFSGEILMALQQLGLIEK